MIIDHAARECVRMRSKMHQTCLIASAVQEHEKNTFICASERASQRSTDTQSGHVTTARSYFCVSFSKIPQTRFHFGFVSISFSVYQFTFDFRLLASILVEIESETKTFKSLILELVNIQ